MNIGLDLAGTHVAVTGGAGLIGTHVVSALLAAGACVSSLDIQHGRGQTAAVRTDGEGRPNLLEHHVDTTDEASVKAAFDRAAATFGTVAGCVALAALDLSVVARHGSSVALPAEQFRRTLDVNVTGTFLTAREWLRGLEAHGEAGAGAGRALANVGLVLVGSESGRFGERTGVDYATSKSAVNVGLLRSLAGDAPRVWRRARVNAVAPGPVDTSRFKQECEADPYQYYADAQGTVALCRPVPPEDVAKTIVVLLSENLSQSIHGQLIPVDGGKQGKVLWTEEEGRRRREEDGQ